MKFSIKPYLFDRFIFLLRFSPWLSTIPIHKFTNILSLDQFSMAELCSAAKSTMDLLLLHMVMMCLAWHFRSMSTRSQLESRCIAVCSSDPQMHSREATALSTQKRNEFSRLFLYMRLITNTSTSRLIPKGIGRGLQETLGISDHPSVISRFCILSCQRSSVNCWINPLVYL